MPDEMNDAQFATLVTDSLRSNIQRIEAIKNFLRDGKQVVAYEKLQGVGDALAYLMGISQRRSPPPENTNATQA
jgi:hypothetical protein